MNSRTEKIDAMQLHLRASLDALRGYPQLPALTERNLVETLYDLITPKAAMTDRPSDRATNEDLNEVRAAIEFAHRACGLIIQKRLKIGPAYTQAQSATWKLTDALKRLDSIEAALAAAPDGAQAVAWQRRTDHALDGTWGPWTECSQQEYSSILALMGGRNTVTLAGAFETPRGHNTLREDECGWPTQVRALYAAPPSQEPGYIVVKEHVWTPVPGERPELAYLWPAAFGCMVFPNADAAHAFIQQPPRLPLGWVVLRLGSGAFAKPEPAVSADAAPSAYTIANNFDAHRKGLPDEFQDWAAEISRDLRQLAAPTGMVLVPRKLSLQMYSAFNAHNGEGVSFHIVQAMWDKMLAAAPTAQLSELGTCSRRCSETGQCDNSCGPIAAAHGAEPKDHAGDSINQLLRDLKDLDSWTRQRGFDRVSNKTFAQLHDRVAALTAAQVTTPFAWYRPADDADEEPEFRTSTPPDGHGWIPVPGAAAPAVVVDEAMRERAAKGMWASAPRGASWEIINPTIKENWLQLADAALAAALNQEKT